MLPKPHKCRHIHTNKKNARAHPCAHTHVCSLQELEASYAAAQNEHLQARSQYEGPVTAIENEVGAEYVCGCVQ